MIILKRYKGEDEWSEISEEEFLDDVEGGGAWKEGTALEALEAVGQISTIWWVYETKEFQRKKNV